MTNKLQTFELSVELESQENYEMQDGYTLEIDLAPNGDHTHKFSNLYSALSGAHIVRSRAIGEDEVSECFAIDIDRSC